MKKSRLMSKSPDVTENVAPWQDTQKRQTAVKGGSCVASNGMCQPRINEKQMRRRESLTRQALGHWLRSGEEGSSEQERLSTASEDSKAETETP